MTEVRGSDRNCLITGEAADGMSQAPMYMAMEMGTAVTSIAAETACEEPMEPMERNEKGKGRRRSEIPMTAWALGDWRSLMERAAQQQGRELAQRHPTVAMMASVPETHTALHEAQGRGTKFWF